MTIASETWTTRRLLTWMAGAFTQKGIDSPRLCAEILVGSVLKCERMRLYMDPDRPASTQELATLRGLVARALKHEPVQYLTGSAWFFGLELTVDQRVLIPRPCTEGIVEWVLQQERKATRREGDQATSDAAVPDSSEKKILIADVCTGSGCIAIALAKHLPGARVLASDISQGALDLASINAGRHGVTDRIEFRAGNLLECLADQAGTLDFIVSNPPYIPDHEWPDVPANVKDYEPAIALRAGTDGLQFFAPLIERGPALLKPGGWIIVEIAASTAAGALALALKNPLLTNAQVQKDLEGLPRLVIAQRV